MIIARSSLRISLGNLRLHSSSAAMTGVLFAGFSKRVSPSMTARRYAGATPLESGAGSA
jgi:hypothetical protein